MASRDRRVTAVLWVVTALAVTIVAFRASGFPRRSESRAIAAIRPVEAPRHDYVSSKTCRACHPDQYGSWHDSYHRRMTQVATFDAIAADLDGLELELLGRSYRFERRGERYWVDIEDREDGSENGEYPIVMTTGSHHRQWIWFATGTRRQLAAVPFIYLIEDRQWVPRIAAFMLPPDPDWAPTHDGGLWSNSCISCHTTYGELASRGVGDPRVVEFGIACEACHGAAQEHVRSNRRPERRYRQHLSEDRDETIVNPAAISHRRSAEVCGRCHSVSLMEVRSAVRPDLVAARGAYRPGDDLATFAREVGRNPIERYARWPDGALRSGGREYDALVATPCFERGEMSCLSCHKMHQPADDPRPPLEWANDQLHPEMDSDEACLQCHDSLEADHSHHEPQSSGSRCYNCHMPYTNYALLKAIRNHRVAGPTVQESVESGRPNACNLCHLDKSLGWTAEHLERWYDTPQPALTEDQRKLAASVLWSVSGDAGQRALTAWHMGWPPAQETSGAGWMAPYLAHLLYDPYASVRYIAYRSLRSLPGFRSFEYNYVATPEERRAVANQVIPLWRAGNPSAPESSDAVLVHPDGVLDRDEFRRLLASRDDRAVNWIE